MDPSGFSAAAGYSIHHGLISLDSQVLQSSKTDTFYYRLEGTLRTEFKYNVARPKKIK